MQERYKSILEERSRTLGEQEEEPLEWWIEAVGPVKKNRILGEPRIPANELLTSSLNGNNAANPPLQSTYGSLPNDLFFKVVKETLQSASSGALFKESLVSHEQVESLAEDFMSGSTSNSEGCIAKEKKEEVVRLVITTLESIFSKVHHSLKEKQIGGQVNATRSPNGVEDTHN
ncbi:unnamed protein product [Rhodiola kirilowii]